MKGLTFGILVTVAVVFFSSAGMYFSYNNRAYFLAVNVAFARQKPVFLGRRYFADGHGCSVSNAVPYL